MADTHRVRIHALAHGGAGVGRAAQEGADTRVWFIPGALPGETVEAVIVAEKKRHLDGRLIAVLEASPERREPPCAIAESCGGCNWQHVSVESQAVLKRDIVVGQLRRLGVKVGEACASPHSLGYRRRARMHYERAGGEFRLGFRRARSKELVDVTECPVLEPALSRGLQRVRELADRLPEQGEVAGLTDGVRAVLGLPGVKPTPELVDAIESMLDETLVGVDLRGGRKRLGVGRTRLTLDGDAQPGISVGALSFAQANARQNQALLDHVASLAAASAEAEGGGRRVLELHAGAGNLTRVLTEHSGRLLAIEGDRDAVASLEAWVRKRGVRVEVRRAAVERALAKLAGSDRRFDLVVLDPPRAGLPRGAAADLATVARGRIIYVSCDPSTLARDLQPLLAAGFTCTNLRVFDMMPMTSEIECVATLDRGVRA